MNEGPKSLSRENKPARIEQSHVIALLQEKGIEDESVRAVIGIWMDQQDELRAKGEIADTEINFGLAEIYRDAGYPEGARESFEAAAMAAEGEGNQDLYERCQEEIQKLIAH